MNLPLILFPEEESARSVGFATCLYDHEPLQTGAAGDALMRVANSGNEQRVILRGWMVPGDIYAPVEKGSDIRGLSIIEETRHFFGRVRWGGLREQFCQLPE